MQCLADKRSTLLVVEGDGATLPEADGTLDHPCESEDGEHQGAPVDEANVFISVHGHKHEKGNTAYPDPVW